MSTKIIQLIRSFWAQTDPCLDLTSKNKARKTQEFPGRLEKKYPTENLGGTILLREKTWNFKFKKIDRKRGNKVPEKLDLSFATTGRWR